MANAIGTPEDREEIHELYARYGMTIDNGQFDDWVDCFTEDGVFESQRFGRHSGVQGLRRFTAIYRESLGGAQVRHVITNVVGGTQPDVHPEVHKLHLEPGDLLLLCSDGLTDMLPDPDIAAILEEEPDPERAGKRLVACANERGGRDNITVILGRMPPLRRIE